MIKLKQLNTFENLEINDQTTITTITDNLSQIILVFCHFTTESFSYFDRLIQAVSRKDKQ